MGSHLTDLLRSQGYQVRSTGRADGNLVDPATALAQVADADIVFHCAGTVGGIGANRAAPYTFWSDNLKTGINVIEACMRWKVKCLVMVGTICSYPAHPPIPFREESFWDGYPEPTNAPYGIAKRALRVGLQGAWKEHGLLYTFLIPTNMYGPRDHCSLEYSHVIPAMIRKMSDAIDGNLSRVDLWGSGFPTRDFLFVKDACRAMVRSAEVAIENGEPLDAINLGSGQEVEIRFLARLIKKIMGYRGMLVWDTRMPDGQPRRCVDSSRANTLLDWRPETVFEEGLRETIKWYLAERPTD